MMSTIMMVIIGTPTTYIHLLLVFVNWPDKSEGMPNHVMSAFVSTINTPALMKVAIVSLVMIDLSIAVLFLYLSKLANFQIESSMMKFKIEIAIDMEIVNRNLQMVFQ